MEKVKRKLRPYIPFTSLNTVWRHISPENKTLLDVGCGKGEPAEFINWKGVYQSVGLDSFEPYLRLCQKDKIHNAYIQGDVRHLPFTNKSFDLVLCLEVLEHLEKQDGENLLQELERVATRQIILSTPAGDYKQDAYDSNPNQEHKYIWNPLEIKVKGYRTIGVGLKNLSGKSGIQSPLPKFLRFLPDILWVLSGPFTYFLPGLAGDMICIKNL